MYNNIYSEVSDLTERQTEILSLVSKGCSNADIAKLLSISPNTVKAHLATVLERLHVSNRTEASVLFEKHLHGQTVFGQDDQELSPFLSINLLYKNLSRTREIAENLSRLILGMEVFSVEARASENLIDDSHDINQPYLIKIDDLSEINATVQISLFSHDRTNNHQVLLYKSAHSLESFEPETLIKHAIIIYRQVLQHQTEQPHNQHDATNQMTRQLCEVLEWVEATNTQQIQAAMKRCEQLLEVRPQWHLLYAIKAVVLYKMITNGLAQDVKADMATLVEMARKSLSLKPESAWSQLAFAYFCVLSSDLIMTEKHLKACLKSNPCQYRAKQLLGQILAFSGQMDASVEVFHQMLHEFPESESAGSSCGALALVHYCAQDFEQSKKMANRALLYKDAPQVPMMLTLLAVAQQQQDEVQIESLLAQLKTANIGVDDIQKSLHVAGKIVPAEYLQGYLRSLQQVGVI